MRMRPNVAGLPAYLSVDVGTANPISDVRIVTGLDEPPAGYVKVPYNTQLGTAHKSYLCVRWWSPEDELLPIASLCLSGVDETPAAIGACRCSV